MGWKERVQGDTAITGAICGVGWKCSAGKLPESPEVILVRTPSNGGCAVSLGSLL